MAELVVVVLRNPPSAPWRSCRIPNSAGGRSGAAARRSMRTNDQATTAHPPSSTPPATNPAGRAMTVNPTTKAMTAAVNTADPARFSDLLGSVSRSGGTETAMITARTAASGRWTKKMSRGSRYASG
jgi:hypothetical protein